MISHRADGNGILYLMRPIRLSLLFMVQSGGQWKETTGAVQETMANLVGAKETARDGECPVVCSLKAQPVARLV